MISKYRLMFAHNISHCITFQYVMIGHIADIVTYILAASAAVADSLSFARNWNQ